MLTKDILFGMNVLTLAGLLLTGFGLTLRRTARAGLPLCLGVMGVGTALVLAGLYASGWPHQKPALRELRRREKPRGPDFKSGGSGCSKPPKP
jgi:hypothetical protein